MRNIRSTIVPFENRPKALYVAIACVIILFFFAIYFHSLFWGYKADDIALLKISWQEWLKSPLLLPATKGRPLWALSYLLTNEVSSAPFFQRAVNLCLLGIIVCVFVAYIYKCRMPIKSSLFLAAALAHPSFIWPITWIAQRNDLLLILSIGLSFLVLDSRSSAVFALLSSAAKTPFIFQNLFFSWKYFCAGRRISSILVLLPMPIFVYAGYKSYYTENVQMPVRHGLYAINRHDLIFAVASLVARAAKAAEGLFYSFVPVGAFAISNMRVVIVGCVLLVLWCIIFCNIASYFVEMWKNRPSVSFIESNLSFDLLVIGLLLCVPYAFGTGLRIYSPALIFIFLGIAGISPPTRVVNISVVLIAAIYLWGVYLNYDANAAPCFSLNDSMDDCVGPAIPEDNWEGLRESAVDKIINKYLKFDR